MSPATRHRLGAGLLDWLERSPAGVPT
jgi:hypothetical protein